MLCAAALVVVGACQGSLEPEVVADGPEGVDNYRPSTGGPDTVGPAAGGPDVGASPMRRMTRFEYNNTVRDLLGDTSLPARDFGEEEEKHGFNNNAASLVTTTALADKYMRAAEAIAERATSELASLADCSLAEPECARAFIAQFLRRAFRRPATASELDAFYNLYLGGLQSSPQVAVSLVLQAALQSPPFLYRLEFAGQPSAKTAVLKLDAFELASRLSYLLWGSLPDETLLVAAETGQLSSKADLEREARRMLDDPRARQMVAEFHREWLDYERVRGVGKDAQLFSGWSAELGEAMIVETEVFVENVVFDGAGNLDALLTAASSPSNPALADFYGPGERRGLLTQGSLLAFNAHSNQTSPVHRGQLVRTRFLCDVIPPPPADVVITVPEPDPNSTTRERLAMHSADPSCAGCHDLMDPIGLGFEHYDGAGRFREQEAGAPVDASGELTQSDVDGEFVGLDELSQKLAASNDVSACYVLQWFRFGYGRDALREDQSTLMQLQDRFAASGEDITELLVALTQTDAFMYRRTKEQP